MAQDVRSRRALTAALLAAACGGESAPTPRAVDVAALPAGELAAAVLAECHAPLRGAMARVAATVTLPDGRAVNVFAALPDRLRAQSTAGVFVLRGDEVRRVVGDAAGPATAAEADEVRALRALVDAAAFGPLHRASRCERLDAATFAATDAAGATTRVALRPGTLLPATFDGAHGTVVVHDYLRTQTTWIARELAIAGLGRCRVRFDSGAVEWSDDVFAWPDAAASAPPRPRVQAPGGGGEPQSPTPIRLAGKALQWACVRDPGDWPGRAAAYAPVHKELVRQRQQIAGFPVLFLQDDVAWLAAPFRRRADGPAFAAPAGWDLREVSDGDLLVCYPDGDDVAARSARGRQELQQALATAGLAARGPVTVQPFVHLHEGAPTPDKLAAAKVRVAVRVD